MHRLQQFWSGLAAGVRNVLGQRTEPRPRPQDIERDLLLLSTEIQSHAGTLERMRADAEQFRLTEHHRLDELEQARRQTEEVETAATGRLSELEQGLSGLQAARRTDGERVAALEAELADTTDRMEARLNQIKFLQDSAREQLQTFKTSLAEATSRLETRDEELARRQDAAAQRDQGLETALAETASRCTANEAAVRDVNADMAGQARQLDEYRAAAAAQYDATANRLTALEQRLESEHALTRKQLEEIRVLLQGQQQHLQRFLFLWMAVFSLVIAILVVLLLFPDFR